MRYGVGDFRGLRTFGREPEEVGQHHPLTLFSIITRYKNKGRMGMLSQKAFYCEVGGSSAFWSPDLKNLHEVSSFLVGIIYTVYVKIVDIHMYNIILFHFYFLHCLLSVLNCCQIWALVIFARPCYSVPTQGRPRGSFHTGFCYVCLPTLLSPRVFLVFLRIRQSHRQSIAVSATKINNSMWPWFETRVRFFFPKRISPLTTHCSSAVIKNR